LKTRLLIVDDHVIMRDGLASIFNLQPDFEVVGEAGTSNEAIARADELKPDVVLMDIGLPDGNGVGATRAILAKNPDIDIVVLTLHDSDEIMLEAIRNGAKGYLLKNTPAIKLIAALRALKNGEAALSRQMTSRLIEEFAGGKRNPQSKDTEIGQLTAREMEILREISSGASNQEIADQLFISVNTVKNHVHDILKKLNVRNRREATLVAVRHGLDKMLP